MSRPQATTKLSSNRIRRREASGSELDESEESDSHAPVKKGKKAKTAGRANREKENATKTPKEAPRVWNEETEKLKALVVTLAQGLPKHVGFKIPTTCYRGNPSDNELQERIENFLKSKGLKNLNPDQEAIAAFQRKVC